MLPPLAVLAEGFDEEDGIVVYRSTEALRARHSPDWFFDQLVAFAPKPVLVDIRRTGTTGEGGRAVVYRRHRELAGRRVAVLGSSRVHEFLISFLIAATGHRDARYFTDEGAARDWLKGGA